MNPTLKYTLGRLGVFLAVLAGLWLVPLNIWLKLMLALIFSAAISAFLLRGWRDEVTAQVATAMERRRVEKERLRAALAGEAEDEGEEEGAGPR